MLKFSSNLDKVASSLMADLKAIADVNGEVRDQMLRTIALDTVAQMKQRIHIDGLNSKGQPIGEYSNSYIKVRQRYNRGEQRKVIFSLTRQMESDFNIVGGSGSTGYSLGFKNPDNADKADWLQQKDRFGQVYKPTEAEVAHMVVVAEQFINDLLNQ